MKISAYINFKGNCLEAMTFYQEVLGGKLDVIIVKDSPMAAMFPAEVQDTVLHADLTSGELNLLASDMQDGTVKEKVGGPVSLTLTCDSKADVMEKYEKLGQGSSSVHPPSTFFAGTMGNVTDKFGIKWGIFSHEI